MTTLEKTPSISSKNNHLSVSIAGKIVRSRRHDKFVYTTVICPSKDQYSRPSVVEIRSKSRFGDVDDEIKVAVELGGYESRSYHYVDKETGEKRSLIPVNHTLDLIES